MSLLLEPIPSRGLDVASAIAVAPDSSEHTQPHPIAHLPRGETASRRIGKREHRGKGWVTSQGAGHGSGACVDSRRLANECPQERRDLLKATPQGPRSVTFGRSRRNYGTARAPAATAEACHTHHSATPSRDPVAYPRSAFT